MTHHGLLLVQGGVVAGLGSAGVMFGAVGAASDLMQDFRTGYLTLASAKVGCSSCCSPSCRFAFSAPCLCHPFCLVFPPACRLSAASPPGLRLAFVMPVLILAGCKVYMLFCPSLSHLFWQCCLCVLYALLSVDCYQDHVVADTTLTPMYHSRMLVVHCYTAKFWQQVSLSSLIV